MAFLGSLLCRERTGPVGHREEVAWPKFWSIQGHLTTRAFGQRARLQHLRTDVLPVLAWCNAAWHLRNEVLRIATGTLIHMARICSQIFRPEGESWVEWQTRAW